MASRVLLPFSLLCVSHIDMTLRTQLARLAGRSALVHDPLPSPSPALVCSSLCVRLVTLVLEDGPDLSCALESSYVGMRVCARRNVYVFFLFSLRRGVLCTEAQ